MLVLVILSGCDYKIVKEEKVQNLSVGIQNNNNTLVNTYRDAKLLFQINYPQDWMVTDYVNNEQDKSEVGSSLVIANYPTPSQGWSIDNPPPGDYLSLSLTIKPNGSMYQDPFKDESSAIQKEKKEIVISDGNKLNIIVYDYKDNSVIQDMGLPTAIAYYYGNSYLYEFEIPGWGPRSEKEISIFKQIVSSFKEIK